MAFFDTETEEALSNNTINFNDFIHADADYITSPALGDGQPTFELPASFSGQKIQHVNPDCIISPAFDHGDLGFEQTAGMESFLSAGPKLEHGPLAHIQPPSVVSSPSPESSTLDSSSDSSGRRKRKHLLSFSSNGPCDVSWMASHDDVIRNRRPEHEPPAMHFDDVDSYSTYMTHPGSNSSARTGTPGLPTNFTSAMENNSASVELFASHPPQDFLEWSIEGRVQASHNLPLSGPNSLALVPARARTPVTFNHGVSVRNDSTLSTPVGSNQMRFTSITDSSDIDKSKHPLRHHFGDNTRRKSSPYSPIFTPTLTSHGAAVGVGPLGSASSRSLQKTVESSTGSIEPPQTRLHVSPLGPKSRVETQINTKCTMDPLPTGIKRLHLDPVTVAKAKCLAKQVPKTPETAELSVMVVRASAMLKEGNLARAMQIARDGLPIGGEPRRSSNGDTKKGSKADVDDPYSPANGGPVKICENCAQRERKRAGRKKAKKQEDEDRWLELEPDRIVMFNTQEYLDFHHPAPSREAQYFDRTVFSTEARQVDLPMRIVCYCRHQHEKMGFQVIFTVKNHLGQVLAQTISESILITDDHKTHGPGGILDRSEIGPFAMPQVMGQPVWISQGLPGLPGRAYHSSTNLVGMNQQSGWVTPTTNSFAPSTNSFGQSTSSFSQSINSYGQSTSSLSQSINSYGLSTNSYGQSSVMSMTARNPSRSASPAGHEGPKKKRKGSSGQHKLPVNLQMTRADLQPLSIPPDATTTQAMNPLLSAGSGASFDSARQFDGHVNAQSLHTTNTSPPNCNMPTSTQDGVGDHQTYYYSAPTSAHASRTASPSSTTRMNSLTPSHAELPATSMASSNVQIPAIELPRVPTMPTIFRITPDSGPITGNVEVVVLGAKFHSNVEVKFGDTPATKMTLWNANTLICLLPPSPVAGPVQVTIADPWRQGHLPPPTSSPKYFTYIDDRNQKLFELAIRLQCRSVLGPTADPWSYAKTVLSDHSVPGGYTNGQASGFDRRMLSNSSTEDLIMAMINKIDLIDSAYKPYFDMQWETGSTMLSLACSLGYEKLVAGLLVRGAHPDVADIGGFTPLMHAAMKGNSAIVRRLILRGADANLRTLNGRTAAELSRTPEVAASLRHVRRHLRSFSTGTPFRSRASSATSARSLWGPPSSGASSTMFSTDDESAIDGSDDGDFFESVPWRVVRSRRSSVKGHLSRRNSNVPDIEDAPMHVPPRDDGAYAATSYAGYAAMLSAFRDQLTAQINQLPQSATWTLPNMEFWQDQNLPAIGRRISNLVPNLPNLRADPSTSDAPPSYHEACPDGANNDFDTKPPKLCVPQAEASGLVHIPKSRNLGDVSVERPSLRERPLVAKGVIIGKKSLPTGKEAAELRRLREETLTPARYDRNLWSIWFPLLIALIIWWSFGLRLPPVFSWLQSVGDYVAETVSTTVVPAVPTRLRQMIP